MAEQNGSQKQALASEMARGAGTMYFFDIRESKNGRPYLSVCTSRRKKGEEKSERNCIFIFAEDIALFFEATERMAKKSESIIEQS